MFGGRNAFGARVGAPESKRQLTETLGAKPSRAVLQRPHMALPLPHLNVVAIEELLRLLKRGGVVRAVQRLDSSEVTVMADGIRAIRRQPGRSFATRIGGSAVFGSLSHRRHHVGR